MAGLTHRERALTALDHGEPDRVPIDLGGSRSSSIILPAYENLKKRMGLEHETKLIAKRQRIVYPDEKILQTFDVDFRPLMLGDFKRKLSKEIDSDTIVDVWGTTWKKAPAGHYINARGVFQDREPTVEMLEGFDWPDPNDPGLFEGLKEKSESLRKETDYAIVLNLGLGIMHQCWFMRGFAEWLMDLSLNKDFAGCFLDKAADLWIKISENALDAVGDNVDVLCFGDDVAMQESTLISPQSYRELVKPRHKRMIAALKSRIDAKVLLHTCGSVYTIIEDFIEIGVDAINPVQVTARNMDPSRLKAEFGDRLCFWGAIDTQRTLPFGRPEEVRKEVRKMIDCLGRDGGYILAAVHNIQAEVPPENIVAMFEEARTYKPVYP
jgi:uroporphyrinogen decarboxylase